MTFYFVEWLAILFILVIGSGALLSLILLFIDLIQTKNAIYHNYPIIGRLRPLFSKLGEFFRRYFFSADRAEMPFNRAKRSWVERAANHEHDTLSFGSTRSLNHPGNVIFVSSPIPLLESESLPNKPLEIGPYTTNPYHAPSFFNISALSYGSISKPAVLALSHGAHLANCWLNTGEGGLSPHHLEGNCDLVFQIGTAKYGVRHKDGTLSEEKLKAVASHEQVKMFEIKLAQGAKPGKGGILPAVKVTEEVSRIRGIPVGKDSISPNRHVEINSIPDILNLVNKIRNITQKPVGFKCVVDNNGWIEELFEEIHRRGIEESAPDFITLDSGDGGSGAAPMPLLDNVSILIKESLPILVDLRNQYKLKNRIRIIASGKLLTSSEVAWALAVGADFVNNARGFMFSIGCIQAMRCNKNTCPTGVTTHKKRLQKGLNPYLKSVKTQNYVDTIRQEVEMIARSCGAKSPRHLMRKHVRVVQPNGQSIALDKLYPEIILT